MTEYEGGKLSDVTLTDLRTERSISAPLRGCAGPEGYSSHAGPRGGKYSGILFWLYRFAGFDVKTPLVSGHVVKACKRLATSC